MYDIYLIANKTKIALVHAYSATKIGNKWQLKLYKCYITDEALLKGIEQIPFEDIAFVVETIHKTVIYDNLHSRHSDYYENEFCKESITLEAYNRTEYKCPNGVIQ